MATFTFQSGATVELAKIRPLLVARITEAARQQWIEEHGEAPARPTYTVETAGGDIETYEHDDTTIDERPEDREAYEAYKAARRDLDAGMMAAGMRAHLIYGVKDGPPDSWREERAYWHIPIPEDERDAKVAWLEDISQGWDELMELVLVIQRFYQGAIEEGAQAALGLFRRPLEDTERADAGTDRGAAEQGE